MPAENQPPYKQEQITKECSFDEMARGIAEGTLTRGQLFKRMGRTLLESRSESRSSVVNHGNPVRKVGEIGVRLGLLGPRFSRNGLFDRLSSLRCSSLAATQSRWPGA